LRATSKQLRVPHLAKVIEFERSAAATLVHGKSRIVRFDFEPRPCCAPLPRDACRTDYEIEITPDAAATAVSAEADQTAVPFH
jgi:hypothetical protein